MLGTAEIRVRPVKLAYLVDPGSASQVRQAVRLSSSLWGGVFFPIIPLYGRSPTSWSDKPLKAPAARTAILGLIEAFDPDILVQLSTSVPSFLSATGLEVVTPESIWRQFGVDGVPTPGHGVGVFEILDDIFREHFRYKSKYPRRVVVPRIPRRFSAFWASVVGEYPDGLLPSIKARYFDPLEMEEARIEPQQLNDLLELNVLFPRRISGYGISLEHPRRFDEGAAVYFMDAAAIQDVVDFWNLRATGRDVLPMPRQFADIPAFRQVVIEFLRRYRVHWPHDRRHCHVASFIRSRNTTMKEMTDFAAALRIERPDGDPSSDGYFVLQHWYPRIWDDWARDKDGGVADVYGSERETLELGDPRNQRMRIRSLLPSIASKRAYTGEARCMNEVAFRFFGANEYVGEVLPKAVGEHLKRAIAEFGLVGTWRSGRNGLVRFVSYEHSEAREFPKAESIFFAWLADQGWSGEVSTAGILAKQIFQLLEGNVQVLRNEQLLKFIEDLNGGTGEVGEAGQDQTAAWQDRCKSVGEVKSRLRECGGGGLHDYLVSKGVFKIGLKIQCPECFRHSWFELAELRGSLTCPKCLTSFLAIGRVDRGSWCYKTSGPFSIPRFADGAFSVLLTLDGLSDRWFPSLRTTSVVSFLAKCKGKPDLEADLGLLWSEDDVAGRRSGIAFGECKTFGEFKRKDLERMQQLAKEFPGAVLVFSTLRKSLTSREVADIGRIARRGQRYWAAERPVNPVLVLTGTELLAEERPPNCWKDGGQAQHARISGILSLCEATQQRHLGLAPWQEVWEKEWSKKRARRANRRGPSS